MNQKKLNCWEFLKCGREPGGARAGELGVCPACTETRADGMNGGKNGGRACWPIAGTFCGGEVQGTFASKLLSCMQCKFYQLVLKEQGKHFQGAGEIIRRLKERS